MGRWLRVRRVIAMVLTLVIGCAILVAVWLLIWESVRQMRANAGTYETQLLGMLDYAGERLPLEQFGLDSQDLDSILRIPQESAGRIVKAVVNSVMSLLSNGLLVLIFVMFIMAGKRHPPRAGSLISEIESRVRRYLLAKVLISAGTAVLVGLTLWLLHVPLALTFGMLAFLLNFIPSIGSVVATLLPLPVVVLNPELGITAKVMAILIPGAIQTAIGNFIEPRIMGQSLGLHPVVILLGLGLFGLLWGVIGMFLSTPIVAVVRIVLQRIGVTAPMGEWMAGRLNSAEESPPPAS
jgi:AI-2 transport protein TqsA